MAALGHTVDPDGSGDYLSLNALETAQQQDLTDGGGDTYTATCVSSGGTADNVAVSVYGWTTSAANYIDIVGEVVFPEYDTSKYRLEVSDSICLQTWEDYVRCRKIQIKGTGAFTSQRFGINVGVQNTGNYILLNSNVITDDHSGNYNFHKIYVNDADSIVDIFNNLIFGSNYFGDGININDAATVNIYNNIIEGQFGDGIQAQVNCTIKNNILANNGDDIEDNAACTVQYNCADDDLDTEFTETTNQQPSGSNWNNELTDYSNGDYSLKTGGNCKDNGVGPATDANVPTTDIDGTTRAGISCDIGADEYAAAGGRPLPQRIFSGPFSGPFEGPFQ